MRDTILIAGDSWGVGEWLDAEGDTIWQHRVSHAGLQRLLLDKKQKVINLSRPGGNNADIWNTCLSAFYNANYQESIRCVIVFQTEWQRDVCDHWHIYEVIDRSFEQLKSRWTSRLYIKLSEIACLYDLPIYIIGGSSDTIWMSKLQDHYPGLEIVCQSMTNLLINDNPRIDDPIMISTQASLLETISHIKCDNLSSEDKIYMMQEFEQSKQRLDNWSDNPRWFYPDGIHANQRGHEKLFDFLCSTIPNFLI